MTRFGTAGIRGSVNTEVTPDLALAVGRATATQARETTTDQPTVVVGRDGRTTGSALADALAAGLQSGGANVVRLGEVPTPAVAFASRDRRGVMVTASHNPPTDNGLKLFLDAEEYNRELEETIDKLVTSEQSPATWDRFGQSQRASVLPDYRSAVVAYASQFGADPQDVRVAVDCGTGMASVATPQVLRELGTDVVALNAQVDGHFPARDSKPTAETLTDLRTFVRDGDFTFGIGHDGDADRIVIVDDEGEIVHEDTVLAVLAGQYVAASEAADPVVVTTPNASARIGEHVRAHGGRIERVRLGALHEGVATAYAAGEDGTEVVFAAEPWKHVHTRFGSWIDGVASAAVLARLVADEGLDALREPITERPYRKISIPCPEDEKERVMAAVETALPEAFPEASVETEYGVRIEREDASWALVRPSGTEPYIRLYAEADDVDALVESVRDVIDRI
ncbi:MAG: phosphomannomutase [Halobacteriales archaeon]|nr:phosphomannomutase [Halobacteriales archaeon]